MRKIFLLFCLLSPFLICDPSSVTVNNVEIRYTLNGEVITQTGYYIQRSRGYIEIYDIAGSISGMSNFQARWSKYDGEWTEWATAPMKATSFWF